jgi:hypothetical protein
MPQNLTIYGRRLYFLSKRRRAVDFYRRRPDLNPQTLGPMVSTLTIKKSRMTYWTLMLITKPSATPHPELHESISVQTNYRLDDRATAVRSPAQQRTFPLAYVSRPSLKSTQSPIQWVLCSFRGGKARSGRDANHSPPSNAEVPLVVFMAVAGQLYFIIIIIIIIIIIRCITHDFSSLKSCKFMLYFK